MTGKRIDVLIVGSGIAGFSAAEKLSESGVAVGLVDSERRLPYKRTKISKNIASGFDSEQFALRPDTWYADQKISLITGESIVSLDLAEHRATTDKGGTLDYGRLLIAAGGKPRELAIPEGLRDRQLFVHSQTDVELLQNRTPAPERILVVGGGVLGTEVAEQLAVAGHSVTFACAGERLMHRHLNEFASQVLLDLFRDSGVVVAMGERIESVEAAEDGIEATISGIAQNFSRVVTCVGIDPIVDLAVSAGMEVNRGIVVDEQLRCSRDDVWAAGDVAEHPGGVITHLWHAAEHQGRVAADNILGAKRTDTLPPFRLKCEVFGNYFFALNTVSDAAVSTEERSGNRYRELWFESERLCGAIMIGDGERAKLYEKAVREGWSRDRVALDLSLAKH